MNGHCTSRRRGFLPSGWATSWLLLLAVAGSMQAAAFQDYFTNRETVITVSGTLNGNNSTATVESSEPRNGGKPGGHSLWISWIAPTNGVATFDTHGSLFDTTLSAYVLNPTNATTVDRLQEVARNDDDPSTPPTSLIQFGALAGVHYEIAVDGFEGATGAVKLSWNFISVASPPPIIVSTPNDQSAKQGDTVSLTVNMIASPAMQLKWFFYDNEVSNEGGITTTNLIISSLQPTNVGIYSLRVSIGSVRYFTTPVEVQINSEGSTNTLATDKLLDSSASPLVGDNILVGNVTPHFLPVPGQSPVGRGLGVVRGYNGTQIFNTTFATTDPAEPPLCGVLGGASYWLMYQPPANGVISIDTLGSSYDTVMEAYTFNGAITSYADLISVDCDNDGFGTNGPSHVTFQVVKTRSYVLAVDGVNGVRGTAWLNYTLNTNLPALPPTLTGQVTTQTVAIGANVLLLPPVDGCLPMKYAWSKDGVTISNAPNAWLALNNVSPSASGNYSLAITNDLGHLTVTIPLHVVASPQCTISAAAGSLALSFPTASGSAYVIEQADAVTGPWQPWSTAFAGDGQNYSTNVAADGTRFFRVRVQ